MSKHDLPHTNDGHAGRRQLRVVLVNMPFAGFRQPSLALGLLKASLSGLPVEVKVLDATLDFAAAISPEAYDAIAGWRAEDLLGDWVFSAALHDLPRGQAPPRADKAAASVARRRYMRDVLEGAEPEHSVPHFGKPPLTPALAAQIAAARDSADGLLTRCSDQIVAAAPLLVGFTDMVHQQTASLALAQRVKAKLPGTFVVFGGPNCRGVMGLELLRSFWCVDAVAAGDGEVLLPTLVRCLLDGRPATGIPGLATRSVLRTAGRDGTPTGAAAGTAGERGDCRGPAQVASPTAPRADLDGLPPPDYGDYFLRLERSPLRGTFVPRVPFEASRGCWWGEKSRCVFCGQASDDLTYRQKTPARALAEMEGLAGDHPGCPFLFSDETVPQSFVDEVVPLLPERLPDLTVLYFEARPALSRSQLATLARAGIRRLEVGIESLSTPVLKLMRKGTSAAQGVQLLRRARELGIEVVWNLIWGVPGESEDDIRAMADLVPRLTHLQPPHTVGAVRLDRFSPLFEERESFGLRDVRPFPAYRHVYDLPEDSLSRLAYHFAFRSDAVDGQSRTAAGTPGASVGREARAPGCRTDVPADAPRIAADATAVLAERVDRWKSAFPQSLLWFADDGRRLVLSDSRPDLATDELTVLDGEHRLLYLACDAAQPAGALAGRLTEAAGRELDVTAIHELAQPLLEQGFLFRDGDRYLSLALPLPDR